MIYGYQQRRVWTMLLLLAAVAVQCGCNRTFYRRQADREANYLVREKSVGTPWEIPDSYTIEPDPRSRFFDSTDPDFPTLPPAGPQLYQYHLPELRSGRQAWHPEAMPETLPQTAPEQLPGVPELQPPPIPDLPANESLPPQPLSQSQHNLPIPLKMPDGVQLASYQQGAVGPVAVQEPNPDPFMEYIDTLVRSRFKVKGLAVQPVGERFWNEIPSNCMELILEFESVRAEYEQTFKRQPGEELRDSAPRVTLPELFELALLNSRDYQRQKEILYQAALDVSIERFAYATKFSVRGGTVDTTYTHARSSGVTVNSLTVPSTFAGDKALATGGTLVGQFANDILLTFNGPSGFAADVSSDLLFEVTQRVFQRDILLEPLIQSERDLVYAARDFARYRKQFFLNVAQEYYAILLQYRRIEISAQNYYAQVRTFQQFLEEVESGVSSAPNVVFLNQFEGSVLEALAGLINLCNAQEQSLDSLKLTLGIPTETEINVDLEELFQLTLRDTIEVNQAQAKRWLTRLEKLRSQGDIESHSDILTADYSLTERLIKWLWERGKIAENVVDARTAFKERANFLLDAARLDLLAERELLAEAQSSDPPKQRILVLQRQIEVIEAELLLIGRQLDYADAMEIRDVRLAEARATWQSMDGLYQQLLGDLEKALDMGSSDEDIADPRQRLSGVLAADENVIIRLIDDATRVLAASETLSQDLDGLMFGMQIDEVDFQRTLERTDRLIEFTQRAFSEAGGGLPLIDISVDEAMITALVQRLDLMNERGALADNWRSIKIAADELKSSLNLSASQRISTDTNRPFSFSTDNANTRLRLAWDLPLNRKRERNTYRRTLINYNVGLRGLMQFEDSIKFNVRREMRNLAQARVQYPISVLGAALAEEQVRSTQLQLTLGIQGVRAIDLLEAYERARTALGQMVDARIRYIIDRAQFAFELEALMLDDTGYWPEINDPKYQPEPNGAYPWNAGSAYGTFPSYLKVSHEFRRMLNQPPPGAPQDMVAPPQQQP